MFDVKPVTTRAPMDCGPTCVKMLLDYYGVDVPLADLIVECRTGVTGTSIKQLGHVLDAHLHGVIEDTHKVYKMDAEELVRQDRPSIIHWKYNHFVVCCGLNDEGKVVICNPDRGRYALTFGTFKSFFTDFTLFMGEPHDLPELAEASAE